MMNYYNDDLAGENSPLFLFDEKRNRKLAYQNIRQYMLDTGLYDAYEDYDFDFRGDSANRLIQYLLKGGYSYLEISRMSGCQDLIDNWIKSDIFRLKSTCSMNYAKTKTKESVVKASAMLVTKFNELPPEVKRIIIIALIMLGIALASYRNEPIDFNNPNFGRRHTTNDAPYQISQIYDNNGSTRHR